MNFRYIKRGFLVLTFSIFWGCASMPKPDGNIADLTKPLNEEYSESLKRGDIDSAIKSLKQIINVYTSNGKLAGGKGELFKYEAAYTALIAHLEFNRGRFPAAAKGWYESFEIEHSGLGYQNEIKQKNAKITDGIATALSAALASAAAQKSGGGVYTYDVFNTVVPKPEMIIAGRPDSSVARVPVRVELSPFDSIVKLNNNNKSYCTATMVSKFVAITAAHCMSQSGEAVSPKLLSVKREGIFSSPVITVEKYYTHLGENKGWDTRRQNDWLILLMATPYDKSGPFPKVYREIPAPIVSGAQNVMLAGYSSDLNKGFYLTLHYGCKFKPNNKSNDGTYLTNCENEKGSSGGAVMTTTKPYSIVGIHTAKLISPRDEYSSVETFGPGFVATLNRLLPENQKIEKLIPPRNLRINY